MSQFEYGDLDGAIQATQPEVDKIPKDQRGPFMLRIERITEPPFLEAYGIETFRCVTPEQFNKVVDFAAEVCEKNPSYLELP
jgi:hypothetical protein